METPNDEEDLLFSGEPAVAADESGAAAPLRVYDFRKPSRISNERMRSLKAMHSLLVKSIESWVAGRVREHVEVELQSLEQISFGDFVQQLPSPCASYIVDIVGNGRQGVIDFGHEFAFYLTDRLLGGVGRHEVPARSLSAMERRVVRIAADRVAALLSDVWNDYVPLTLNVEGFESIPEMLRVANREDPVLVAILRVTSGDMSSELVLSLPFITLDEFFTGSSSRRPEEPQGSPEERRVDRDLIESTVRDTRIPVEARLPAFRASMGELASLRTGDLLYTGLETKAELQVFAAGQRRFRGTPGRVGRNLAVRVIDRVRPDPEYLIGDTRDEPTN